MTNNSDYTFLMVQPLIALVTGAGRGIGAAIARRFAREGYTVLLVSRTQEQLSATAAAIEASGGKACCHPADVSDPAQVEKLFQEVADRHGRLDVLANNAGLCVNAGVETMSVADYQRQNRVNLDGVFYCTHFAWPLLKKSGNATIINISSMAAKDPYPGLEIYGGTKAAVEAWTTGWAREGAKAGIRVYSIGPAATETDMLRQLFPDVPPEECLHPDDVAELAFTLSGPTGRYVSGSKLYIGKPSV